MFDADLVALGDRVRARRMVLDLSQTALAKKIKLSNGFISRMEAGQHEARAENLEAVALELGVTVNYLVSGDFKIPPPLKLKEDDDVPRTPLITVSPADEAVCSCNICSRKAGDHKISSIIEYDGMSLCNQCIGVFMDKLSDQGHQFEFNTRKNRYYIEMGCEELGFKKYYIEPRRH